MPKLYIQNEFLSELLLCLLPLLGVKPNWLLVFKVSYVYTINILLKIVARRETIAEMNMKKMM